MELQTPAVERLSRTINGATAHKYRIIALGQCDGHYLIATDRLMHRTERSEMAVLGSPLSLFAAPVQPVLFHTAEFSAALIRLYPNDQDGDPYSFPISIFPGSGSVGDDLLEDRRVATLGAAVRDPDVVSASIGIDHDHGWQSIIHREPPDTVYDRIDICDAMDVLYMFLLQGFYLSLPAEAIWRYASGILHGKLAVYRWSIHPLARGFGVTLELAKPPKVLSEV
jgi:hypothetical protein